MSMFKKLIENYNLSNINQSNIIEAMAAFEIALNYLEVRDKNMFWVTMKQFHEHIKGKHFDKMYATYQVDNMFHKRKDGTICKGEVFTMDKARQVYEQHVRHINSSNTICDVYVAINAQYHDYVCVYKELFPNINEDDLNHKIILTAVTFWFKDDDAPEGKVWNYFKS